VFENRVLRRIFGPKRVGRLETGENCTMRSFINLYCSPDTIRMKKPRRMRKRNQYRILVGKPEGKRPLGRPRCTREDIKMVLQK
jgi:hypothetical protein